MMDLFGRKIEYLRLSVTDRCNLDCGYCKKTQASSRRIINFEEIDMVVKLFTELGISKIRLTGGEPLVRSDITDIIRLCKDKYRVKDVSLTTNGMLLAEKAEKLKASGLDRVNISIDSLKPSRYKDITGSESLHPVLEGIKKASDAGLNPVKVNVVVMRGKNEDEIDDFISMAGENRIEIRFIEHMPMGKSKNKEFFISSEEILKQRKHLFRIGDCGVARNYTAEGYKGKVGFISPISEPFCDKCNKVRVTADMYLRTCLGNNREIDLRQIIMKENAPALLEKEISKKPEKGFCKGFNANRGMRSIGG